MTTNELIERLRSKRPINLETLSDLLGEAADCIEGLEDRIAEKQKHLENLQKVNEDLEERIAIMSKGGWCPDWHFFTFRPATDEEKEYYGMEDYDDATMLENCPDDGEEVILLTPWGMSIDTYHWDIDGSYFDEHDDIEKGWAWTATPKPPKKGEAE